MSDIPRVIVAGVGGASLGTEIVKALRLADRYTVFACDISPLAFGHYMDAVESSILVDADDYVSSVLDVCIRHEVSLIIAGAEAATTALSAGADEFKAAGINLVGNSPEVITLCSDKAKLFEFLGDAGVGRHPWTASVSTVDELARLGDLPPVCIVKPATGSGGSRFVFLATSTYEIETYVRLLSSQGLVSVLQEYISEDEGEFTIGVLSLPDGQIAGSVALRRAFSSKLSVMSRSSAGLISSGYSQGLIDDFPELRAQAEQIASTLSSAGPLNVQARVRDGELLVFEINPRFSASTYLRALAGFNEVDVFLQSIIYGRALQLTELRAGYYLRSFDEIYVPLDRVKS